VNASHAFVEHACLQVCIKEDRCEVRISVCEGSFCQGCLFLNTVMTANRCTSMVQIRLLHTSVLAGISRSLQNWLQSILYAASQLVCSARKLVHITPLIQELHWSCFSRAYPVLSCVLAYCCIHGTVPACLADSLPLNGHAKLYRQHMRRRRPSCRSAVIARRSFDWNLRTLCGIAFMSGRVGMCK